MKGPAAKPPAGVGESQTAPYAGAVAARDGRPCRGRGFTAPRTPAPGCPRRRRGSGRRRDERGHHEAGDRLPPLARASLSCTRHAREAHLHQLTRRQLLPYLGLIAAGLAVACTPLKIL